MTINQLRYFLEICDCSSITHAAQKLYITSQALSKTVNSLETELDTPLFLRTKSGIVLTEAGQYLRDQCRPIVEQFDNFTSVLHYNIRLASGTLRLCIFENCFDIITIDDFSRFHTFYPQYELEIKEFPFQICNQLLMTGEQDAVLTLEPIPDKDITTLPIQLRERVLIVRNDNPLASQETIRIQDLQQEKFVLSMNERDLNLFYQFCRQYGYTPNIVQILSQVSTMMEMCSSGGYTGLVADFVSEKLALRYPNLVFKHFADNQFPYPIMLAYRTDSGKQQVLKAFINFLQTILK